MKQLNNLFLTSLLLLFSLQACGGGESEAIRIRQHSFKPRAFNGSITSIEGTSLKLKTEKITEESLNNVVITSDTKITQGNVVKAIGDLKQGAPIIVLGTKLASGELVAKEIMLHADVQEEHTLITTKKSRHLERPKR